MERCFAGRRARMTYDDLRRCIDPHAAGAVRVSLGLVSNFADAFAFRRVRRDPARGAITRGGPGPSRVSVEQAEPCPTPGGSIRSRTPRPLPPPAGAWRRWSRGGDEVHVTEDELPRREGRTCPRFLEGGLPGLICWKKDWPTGTARGGGYVRRARRPRRARLHPRRLRPERSSLGPAGEAPPRTSPGPVAGERRGGRGSPTRSSGQAPRPRA